MTTSTTFTSKVALGWDNQDNTESIAVIKNIEQLKHEVSYAYGSGAYQLEEIHASVNTVTPSTTDASFDLSAIVNGVNETIAFDLIKGIHIKNTTVTTGHDLLVGGAAANPWDIPWNAVGTEKTLIGPGGVMLLESPVDGYAVTDNSADILLVAHNAGAGDITFHLVLWGTLR